MASLPAQLVSGNTPPLTGERAARAYLDLLRLALEPGEVLEVRARPEGAGAGSQTWDATTAGLLQAVRFYARQGRHVYLGVHPRHGKGLTGNANVPGALFIVADIDAKDLDPEGYWADPNTGARLAGAGPRPNRRAKWVGDWRRGLPVAERVVADLVQSPYRPTAVVHSGRGFHLYYLLRERLDFTDPADLALYRELVARLALAVGGDQSIGNPERILRVPGPPNVKAQPGIPTALLYVEPDRAYNPGDLDEWLPPLPAGWDTPTEHQVGAPVELPADLEPNLKATVAALGIAARVVRVDGRVKAVQLERCPYHGQRDSADRYSAWVSPLAGTLRCWHSTCPACHEHGGIPYATWAPEHARTAAAAIRHRLGQHWAVPAVEARTVTADQVDAELERLTVEAVERSTSTGHPVVVVVPPGWGKTRAVLRLMAEDTDGRYAYLARSHTDLTEKLAEYQELGGTGAAEYIGCATACLYPEAYRRYPSPELWRRTACYGCPDKGDCRAWKNDTHARVLFAPQAALDTLARDDGDHAPALAERVVVWDEFVPAVEDRTYTLADVERATARSTFGALAEVGLVLARAALLTLDMVKVLAARYADDTAGKGSRYGATFTGDQVGEALSAAIRRRATGGVEPFPGMELPTTTAAAITADMEALRSAGRVQADEIPAPSGDRLRAGDFAPGDLLRHDLPKLFATLARAGDSDADRRAGVTLSVTVTGTPTNPVVMFTLHRRVNLDTVGAPTVVLDATGHYTRATVEAAAGGPVEVLALDVRPVEGAQIHRLFIPTKGANRRRAITAHAPSARGEELFMSTLAAVHRHAREVLPQGAEVRSGVVTFQHLAHALNADTGTLDAYRRALDLDGVELVEAGYFGRDERATNRYRDCNVVGCWGAPIPNLGAMRALAYSITTLTGVAVDAGDLATAHTAAALVQALGRARAEQRAEPVVLWHAGQHPPPGWTEYQVVELPAHRHTTDVVEGVAEVAVELLQAFGVSSPSLGLSAYSASLCGMGLRGISQGTIRTMNRLQELREMPSWRRVQEVWVKACEAAGAVRVSSGTGGGALWTWPALAEDVDHVRALAAEVHAAAAPVVAEVVDIRPVPVALPLAAGGEGGAQRRARWGDQVAAGELVLFAPGGGGGGGEA